MICRKIATTAKPHNVLGSLELTNCSTLAVTGITTISHMSAISSSVRQHDRPPKAAESASRVYEKGQQLRTRVNAGSLTSSEMQGRVSSVVQRRKEGGRTSHPENRSSSRSMLNIRVLCRIIGDTIVKGSKMLHCSDHEMTSLAPSRISPSDEKFEHHQRSCTLSTSFPQSSPLIYRSYRSIRHRSSERISHLAVLTIISYWRRFDICQGRRSCSDD